LPFNFNGLKTQQISLVTLGTLLVILLYAFGKTVPARKNKPVPESTLHNTHEHFDIKAAIAAAKTKLSAPQQAYVYSLESSVVRGDVKNQQIHTYHQLASFWKDSVPNLETYAYYTAEASKLENSEKSLTFAARLFLDNVRTTSDPELKSWMAEEARDLFERSLKINPSNDSAKIGLGSSYIFGAVSNDPQQVMKGIQQILEVARRDSANMYAQLMLGIGGVVSGQLDKAIDRLLTVVKHQPGNLEAVLTLAEAYERKGDKPNGVKWYEHSKKFIANKEVIKEIDERIKSLK
jgi:tetratricopeptide (TPR) repeat protein